MNVGLYGAASYKSQHDMLDFKSTIRNYMYEANIRWMYSTTLVALSIIRHGELQNAYAYTVRCVKYVKWYVTGVHVQLMQVFHDGLGDQFDGNKIYSYRSRLII